MRLKNYEVYVVTKSDKDNFFQDLNQKTKKPFGGETLLFAKIPSGLSFLTSPK